MCWPMEPDGRWANSPAQSPTSTSGQANFDSSFFVLFGIGNLSGNERQQTKDKVRRLFIQSRRPQLLHPDRRGPLWRRFSQRGGRRRKSEAEYLDYGSSNEDAVTVNVLVMLASRIACRQVGGITYFKDVFALRWVAGE